MLLVKREMLMKREKIYNYAVKVKGEEKYLFFKNYTRDYNKTIQIGNIGQAALYTDTKEAEELKNTALNTMDLETEIIPIEVVQNV